MFCNDYTYFVSDVVSRQVAEEEDEGKDTEEEEDDEVESRRDQHVSVTYENIKINMSVLRCRTRTCVNVIDNDNRPEK